MIENLIQRSIIDKKLIEDTEIREVSFKEKQLGYDCDQEGLLGAANLWCDNETELQRVAEAIGQSIAGPYEELSEADMAAMIQAVPVGDDWEQDVDIIVLPLSLSQFWDAFWADDAPYQVPGYYLGPEDELLGFTKWGAPSAGFETEFDMPVIKERIVDFNMKIDSAFADTVHSVKHVCLVERSSHKITMKATSVNDGAPYTEDFRAMLRWDILTDDPRSNQVAVRQLYTLEWMDDKPLFVGDYVEKLAFEGIWETNDGFEEWFKQSAQSFLAGPPYANPLTLELD